MANIRNIHKKRESEIKICGTCKGKGIKQKYAGIKGHIIGEYECPMCKGSGRIIEIEEMTITQQPFVPPILKKKTKKTRKKINKEINYVEKKSKKTGTFIY